VDALPDESLDAAQVLLRQGPGPVPARLTLRPMTRTRRRARSRGSAKLGGPDVPLPNVSPAVGSVLKRMNGPWPSRQRWATVPGLSPADVLRFSTSSYRSGKLDTAAGIGSPRRARISVGFARGLGLLRGNKVARNPIRPPHHEVAWRKGHRYLTLVGDHRQGMRDVGLRGHGPGRR
jgi:hypothetical protein